MANSPTAVILGRSPEDLLPPAKVGEIEGGDATADARHKAEHDDHNTDLQSAAYSDASPTIVLLASYSSL